LDLIDYISQSELTTTLVKDKFYDKILIDLDEFLKNLTEKDKQLISQTISKCYLKYQDSIKANGTSGFELNRGLLMSLLLDQQLQIDNLIKKLK
jgi:hypothetical protein